MTRMVNDYAAKARSDHPGRFGLFAYVPMPDIDGTLKEIAYALDELKADGIGLSTSYGNQFLGDPDFKPVMDELQRRRAIVYVHPGRPDCCDTLTPQVPGSFTEYPQDTNRTVMSLLFSGTFTRTRDVRWIFSHGGAAVPLLAGRVNSLAKIQLKNQAQVLPDGIDFELKRLHYETANAAYAPNIAALLKFASAVAGPVRDRLPLCVGGRERQRSDEGRPVGGRPQGDRERERLEADAAAENLGFDATAGVRAVHRGSLGADRDDSPCRKTRHDQSQRRTDQFKSTHDAILIFDCYVIHALILRPILRAALFDLSS